MANIQFLRGVQANLDALTQDKIINGALYFTTDTHKIYMGGTAGLQEYSAIELVANMASLPAVSASIKGKFYYAEAENVFCFAHDGVWQQVNPDTGATSVEATGDGNAITAASYDAATRKITLTKGETFATKASVDQLSDYVGTIPETAEAKDIVAYIQEKTAGIATDTALEELTGRVATAEGEIDALQAAIAEEGAVTKAIADAQKAANDAAAAAAVADGKAATAQGEVDALETVVSEYKTSNDIAVKAAADAAQAAQDDVDALEGKVGEVPAGETVVSMIAAAEKLAGDAMGAANSKVASVAAGDASVTVAGTATAPTIAAKLSQDADNALQLAEDGLKVVIPAAAEYAIVKAEDAGEYAAVYNLTKNGAIVGASINIPKDMVVKSGSVVNGEIVLILNDEANTEIKIPANSLIEYVTSGSAADDMVVINVSDDHKVTATITDGTIGLEKLTVDVQTKINKAHSHENADVLAGISATDIENWNSAEQNAIGVATELNTAMNTRVEALEAIDHEHANKSELDLIVSGDKAKWDAAAELLAPVNESGAQTLEVFVSAIVDEGIQSYGQSMQPVLEQINGQFETIEEALEGHTAQIKKIEDDYLTSADKAVLEQSIGTKANASEVYKKGETYTQDEVNAAIETAVNEATSWGEF